jgi:hypothetical protein
MSEPTAAHDLANIAELVGAVKHAVTQGDPNAMRTMLDEIFHKDMVIRGPEFKLMAEGKLACIESYVTFARDASVLSFEISQPVIDLFDDMAVAKYDWTMRYALNGAEHNERGNDVFMFVRESGRWLVAWRALSVS